MELVNCWLTPPQGRPTMQSGLVCLCADIAHTSMFAVVFMETFK